MNKYKLHITFDFEQEDNKEATAHAKYLLNFLRKLSRIPEVALNYTGDRSAKNLLAPIKDSPNHYKNSKIKLDQIEE